MSRTSPTWLIDKSVYARLGSGPDNQAWADRFDRGLVRITTLTRLELGYSARTAADWRAELDVAPLAAMPIQCLTPAIEDCAVEVQPLTRRPRPAPDAQYSDLMVAATAELAGLIFLHFDKTFDLITEVTGLLTERLAVNGWEGR